MKLLTFIGLLATFWMVMSPLHAGLKNTNNVQRLGPPPPDYKNPPKKDLESEREALPLGLEAPNKYGGIRFRVVDGKIYDLGPVITWANERAFLKTMAPKSLKELPKIRDWEIRAIRNVEEGQNYQNYLVTGKVVRVLPEGVLVQIKTGMEINADQTKEFTAELRPDGTIVRIPVKSTKAEWVKRLLKNHPQQDQLVDDDDVDVLAIPAGTFANSNILGKNITIRAYDYGRAYNRETDVGLVQAELPLTKIRN